MFRKPEVQQNTIGIEVLGRSTINEYEKNICNKLDGTKKHIIVDFEREGDTWFNKEFGGISKRTDLSEFDVPGAIIESTTGKTYWTTSPEEDIKQKLFPLKSGITTEKVITSFRLQQLKDKIKNRR